MKCKECNNDLEEGIPACFTCVNNEHQKQLSKDLFKHDVLIEALAEFGLHAEFEYDEGEYSTSGYWYFERTDKKDESVEGFYPEDALRLYEIIIKKLDEKKGHYNDR